MKVVLAGGGHSSAFFWMLFIIMIACLAQSSGLYRAFAEEIPSARTGEVIAEPESSVDQNRIVVDFSKQSDVRPFVFGHNTLGFDPCSKTRSKECVNKGEFSRYGAGQWDPLAGQASRDLVALAREINVSMLRFPGGCGTHNYNWKQTIGPVKDRPMFQFGLDEFLALCEKVGAEPIIVFSSFTGTGEDAADMVEYLNQPLEASDAGGRGKWARERARNGHPEPYGVKYFEFGNEVYHGNHTTIASVDPEVYARRYLHYRELIKAVDPELKLGAVLYGRPTGKESWNIKVAQTINGSMDFGIIHVYPVGYRSNDPSCDAEELFRIALAAPDQVEKRLEILSTQVKDYTGKEIPLAITEYNGEFVQKKPVPYRHSLGNALLNADLLRIYLTTRTPILCANYFHFANSYWGLTYNPSYRTGEGSYFKRPNYYVFELYAKHFGNRLLETQVFSERYTSPAFGDVQATSNLVAEGSTDFWEMASFPVPPQAWKVKRRGGVDVNRNPDDIVVHFTGSKDVNYFHTQFTKPIESSHRYRLRALIRAENLTTLSGVGLEVQDGRGWKKTRWAKSTQKVSGTTDWNSIVMEFEPLPDAESIKVMVRRLSGYGEVSGNIRVKDVVLEDLGPAPPASSTPYLSAVASTNQIGNRVYLAVINKHLKEKMHATIQIRNYPLSGDGYYWLLNGPAVDATNEGQRENVRISEGKISFDASSGQFGFQFEPHSLTFIELGSYAKQAPQLVQ